MKNKTGGQEEMRTLQRQTEWGGARDGREGRDRGGVRQPVACALIFFFPLVAAAPSQLRMTVWRA